MQSCNPGLHSLPHPHWLHECTISSLMPLEHHPRSEPFLSRPPSRVIPWKFRHRLTIYAQWLATRSRKLCCGSSDKFSGPAPAQIVDMEHRLKLLLVLGSSPTAKITPTAIQYIQSCSSFGNNFMQILSIRPQISFPRYLWVFHCHAMTVHGVVVFLIYIPRMVDKRFRLFPCMMDPTQKKPEIIEPGKARTSETDRLTSGFRISDASCTYNCKEFLVEVRSNKLSDQEYVAVAVAAIT